MSSKTHYGTVLDKNDVGNYKPIIVKQTFKTIPKYTNKKKSKKGGKGKKRRTYKKKRNSNYLKR